MKAFGDHLGPSLEALGSTGCPDDSDTCQLHLRVLRCTGLLENNIKVSRFACGSRVVPS